MIRIAVCDDEPAFAERVKTLIEEECRALSVSSETVLYTDSGMLAYDIGEKRYFDMLFLDIEMPGLSGMELADLIKDSLPQSLVSFITSHTKYAVKSFELSGGGMLLIHGGFGWDPAAFLEGEGVLRGGNTAPDHEGGDERHSLHL